MDCQKYVPIPERIFVTNSYAAGPYSEYYYGQRHKINQASINLWRSIMEDRKVQNYMEYDEEREQGHVDTRSTNFECENKDERLGCDPGIDVAG